MLRQRLLFAGVILLGGVMVIGSSSGQEKQAGDDGKLLRHVVMFEFKEDASEADIQEVVDAFKALPSKIPQIHDFEWGTNNSPEGLDEGLTHIFLVTFKSEADRAAYLPHPAHKTFVETLQPHLKRPVVVDYWAED